MSALRNVRLSGCLPQSLTTSSFKKAFKSWFGEKHPDLYGGLVSGVMGFARSACLSSCSRSRSLAGAPWLHSGAVAVRVRRRVRSVMVMIVTSAFIHRLLERDIREFPTHPSEQAHSCVRAAVPGGRYYSVLPITFALFTSACHALPASSPPPLAGLPVRSCVLPDTTTQT